MLEWRHDKIPKSKYPRQCFELSCCDFTSFLFLGYHTRTRTYCSWLKLNQMVKILVEIGMLASEAREYFNYSNRKRKKTAAIGIL